jgi:hypothetical protein
MKISATITTSPLETFRALDPTITVGSALATATGYACRGYDGTLAAFEGHERFVPNTGGPYLPPDPGGHHSKIVFYVAALPKVDPDRGTVVFPVDAVEKSYEYTWSNSDMYGGY